MAPKLTSEVFPVDVRVPVAPLAFKLAYETPTSTPSLLLHPLPQLVSAALSFNASVMPVAGLTVCVEVAP